VLYIETVGKTEWRATVEREFLNLPIKTGMSAKEPIPADENVGSSWVGQGNIKVILAKQNRHERNELIPEDENVRNSSA